MKTSAFQLTLRELRTQISSARTWAILGVVALILGLSGPFQTFEYLALAPRLAYWMFMSSASFWVGNFFGTWAHNVCVNRKVPFFARFVIVGISAGIPVAILVILLNLMVLNYGYDASSILTLGIYCIGIAFAVTGIFELFHQSSKTNEAPQVAKILSRVPVEKRGELISMSVQDHYVEIVTSRGTHLTLMRLSDAISETQGTQGLQIHRSHWVAQNAIKSVQRKGGKTFVVTENRQELPVSRTYIKPLRDAGLLV